MLRQPPRACCVPIDCEYVLCAGVRLDQVMVASVGEEGLYAPLSVVPRDTTVDEEVAEYCRRWKPIALELLIELVERIDSSDGKFKARGESLHRS